MIHAKAAEVLCVVVDHVFVIGKEIDMTFSILSNLKIGSKKFIRKQAIERVKENINYQQKVVSDYSKEELKIFILNEEKKILKSASIKSVLIAAGALVGITYI